MQLFLGAEFIILRLFSKVRRYLLFSNYSQNNLPKPTQHQCLIKPKMYAVDGEINQHTKSL